MVSGEALVEYDGASGSGVEVGSTPLGGFSAEGCDRKPLRRSNDRIAD